MIITSFSRTPAYMGIPLGNSITPYIAPSALFRAQVSGFTFSSSVIVVYCFIHMANAFDNAFAMFPVIDAQSIGKKMEVQCAAGGRHIAPTFPIIDAQSSSRPDPLEKIWRCNVPPPGGTLHRLFHSSERPLPMDRNNREGPLPIDQNSRERHCIPNNSE